jgi:hypothetical protein
MKRLSSVHLTQNTRCIRRVWYTCVPVSERADSLYPQSVGISALWPLRAARSSRLVLRTSGDGFPLGSASGDSHLHTHYARQAVRAACLSCDGAAARMPSWHGRRGRSKPCWPRCVRVCAGRERLRWGRLAARTMDYCCRRGSSSSEATGGLGGGAPRGSCLGCNRRCGWCGRSCSQHSSRRRPHCIGCLTAWPTRTRSCAASVAGCSASCHASHRIASHRMM